MVESLDSDGLLSQIIDMASFFFFNFMFLSGLITYIAAFVFLSADFKLENIVDHLNNGRYAICSIDSSQPRLKENYTKSNNTKAKKSQIIPYFMMKKNIFLFPEIVDQDL